MWVDTRPSLIKPSRTPSVLLGGKSARDAQVTLGLMYCYTTTDVQNNMCMQVKYVVNQKPATALIKPD